ncbi:MAG: protein adenylyltransferase SelO family protein [Alysiella sp.]|nr:protein adenylyltransferase SelO family protein [Alysiella sp.]MDO4434026.1 protein adenylyltransferase SelO family protein [Alysiella sp.]
MAAWQAVGFCHGVLNTDNMSVLGLTIDYGPYGFLNQYNRHHICNHSDHKGRYAYYQQPYIVHWNLSRLGGCFQELADYEQLSQILHDFVAQFQAAYHTQMRAKLGFKQPEKNDEALFDDLSHVLHTLRCDYTLFFRYLADLDSTHNAPLPAKLVNLLGKKVQEPIFQHWLYTYRNRLRTEQHDPNERAAAMNAVNPLYIARNHLLHHAIELAQQGDFAAIHRLQNCLKTPFTEQADYADLALPPDDDTPVCVISCSS